MRRIKRSRRLEVARQRTLGAGFLVLLVLFGWLTYAFFTDSFSDRAEVTLHTSHAGLQLSEDADVKLRGLIVGEVSEIEVADDGSATVRLALEKETLAVIPAGVSARIVPKTLFGEKYVDLVPPADPSGQALASGDVISRDRSSVGIELERVLDETLPLLRTIKPAQLNATLNAMSTALEGRGEKVGRNLEILNAYLAELNPHVPALTEDVSDLADVAEAYGDATPDLMRLLENTTKTGNTVVLKQRVLEDFLTDLAATSVSSRTFLAQNENEMIQVGEVTRPTLDLLGTYSPEYACMLEAMADWIPRFDDAFGSGEHYNGRAPAFHITLELVPQREAYDHEDRPEYLDDRGPGCRQLRDIPYSQDNPGPGSGVLTGVEKEAESHPPPIDIGIGTDTGDGVGLGIGSGAAGGVLFNPTSGYAGTAEEQELVNALLAPAMGTSPDEVPDLATLLFGPLARGAEVNLR